jgi:hypothetical protein
MEISNIPGLLRESQTFPAYCGNLKHSRPVAGILNIPGLLLESQTFPAYCGNLKHSRPSEAGISNIPGLLLESQTSMGAAQGTPQGALQGTSLPISALLWETGLRFSFGD